MPAPVDPHPPVLLIGGPTAAGKSGLAMEIAEQYGAVVVSADAMTVWRGLDVGTAKPTTAERARVPHRCIDVRSLHEAFNVSVFSMKSMPLVSVPACGCGRGYPSTLRHWYARWRFFHHRIRDSCIVGAPPLGLAAGGRPGPCRKAPPKRPRTNHPGEVHRITGEPMSVRQNGPPARPPIAAQVWLTATTC